MVVTATSLAATAAAGAGGQHGAITAGAEQEDENEDPANVVATAAKESGITVHNNYLRRWI